jgi:metallo-beta-lactamase family protein
VSPAQEATMTATLTFLGAAGTVTGSKFLVTDGEARVMVDCGLYQGERRWRRQNWEEPPVDTRSLDDVVLTHAHLDHCGYFPALVRRGYEGPAWATEGTAQLASIVLRDSAHLQEEDALHAATGGWSRHDPPLPLYDVADAERAIERFRTQPFDQRFPLSSQGFVTFGRAGHILGSATVLLELGGGSVLFSGDLGRPTHPLLRPRSAPPAARTVVIESTYGNRTHPAPDRAHSVLADAVRRTIGRGGSVVIPAFAVDRTELVLLALARLRAAGAIPDVPVYVDSPMALRALDVYEQAGVAAELTGTGLGELSALHHLHAARTPDESQALNNPGTPCIIVSASGMATGGRVVHHLRHLLPHARNTVVLTGYQAAGTRGRDLLEGAHEVKIMGRYVRVRAEVVADDGFSVHADSEELLQWLGLLPTPPETVYVVHGEPEAREVLAASIREAIDCTVVAPRLGERVVVD